jgi:hypothetical protein
MRLAYRLLIAIPLGIGLIALVVTVYPIGFFLGGMATDSCSHLPPMGLAFLALFWPLVMGVSAILPAILIIRQVRWRWVVLSAVIGLASSVTVYLLWYVLLMFTC